MTGSRFRVIVIVAVADSLRKVVLERLTPTLNYQSPREGRSHAKQVMGVVSGYL